MRMAALCVHVCFARVALHLLCRDCCVAFAVLQSLVRDCCIVFDQSLHLVTAFTIPTLMNVPSHGGCMYCERSTCIRSGPSTCFTVHSAQVPRNLHLGI